MAPEILQQDETETDLGIDIWSLGVLLYMLLYGFYPFKGPTRLEVRKAIKQGLLFPAEISITSNAKDLIRNMLTHKD